MNRARSILFCGLVALMMVGMVHGDEVGTGGGNTTQAGDLIYIGTWAPGNIECLPGGSECLHISVSFSLQWFKDLFRF